MAVPTAEIAESFDLRSDSRTLKLNLRKGTMFDTPPIRDTARYQQDPNWQVVFNNIAGDSYVITFNTTQPPTDNKLPRQAMSFALDRQRIADSVLQNVGAPKNIPYAAWRDYFLDQQWAMVVTSKRPRVATSSKVHGIGSPPL
jgi:ABC-type transport system substrate-binding protein